MPLNLKRIEKQIGNIKIILTPYSFIKEKDRFISVAETIDSFEKEINKLYGCCVVECAGHLIIRTSSMDTPEKIDQLKSLLKNVSAPLNPRVCFIQLNSPDEDWLSISSEHQRLLKLDFPLTHINFPIETLFIASTAVEEPTSVQIGVENLAIYQNSCSWIIYGEWFEQEIKKVLKTIAELNLDLYSLKLSLEDFVLELHSPFLKSAQDKIDAIKLNISTFEYLEQMDAQQKIRLLFLEKDLLAARYDLVEVLRLLYFYLTQIVAEATKFEVEYPFLTALKQQASLLHLLIGSQTANESQLNFSRGQQIVLLQLLNYCQGIRVSSLSENGMERTSFICALQLSVIILLRNHSVDELLYMIINWEVEKNNNLANELKHTAWDIFLQFSLPLIEHLDQPREFLNSDEDILNEEWMEFFPENIQKRQIIEHLVSIRSPYGH